MALFGKIDENQLNKENQQAEAILEAEFKEIKPDSQEEAKKEDSPITNVVGNVLSITGQAALLIGGMGAAMLAFNYILVTFGLSAIVTILVLMAIGFALSYFAPKLITKSWLIQPQGV
jgi:hypothetical protein